MTRESGKLEHSFGVFLKYDVDLLISYAFHAHMGNNGCQDMVVTESTVVTQIGFIEYVM